MTLSQRLPPRVRRHIVTLLGSGLIQSLTEAVMAASNAIIESREEYSRLGLASCVVLREVGTGYS